MGDIALRVVGLGKDLALGQRRRGYRSVRDGLRDVITRRRTGEPSLVTALDEVTFDVVAGQTVGFIGHNGAGKSTLLKILSRITPPTRGFAEVHGTVGALLEVGTGFHPELTGRENIFLNGAILGMTRREISAKFDDIVEFAGVERFLDTPVKHYSSGMSVRLAFAVAAHIEPEILLVDEVLAVGDVAFQRRCLERITQLADEGRTVLFVSHNMAVIQGLCERGIVLRDGRIVADGDIDEAIRVYLATFEQAHTVPIADRTDRQGIGAVRATSVTVAGSDGRVPTTGAPAVIEVAFDPPWATVTCEMTVFDEFGLPLVSFDSANIGESDTATGRPGVFRCEIDQLLLMPGRYRIDLGLQDGRHWQDGVHAAAYFDVEQARAGGRPVLPYLRGSTFLPHTWTNPS